MSVIQLLRTIEIRNRKSLDFCQCAKATNRWSTKNLHGRKLSKNELVLFGRSQRSPRSLNISPVRSFSSDIVLYNLTYYDIFTLSVWKNLLMLQLPSMMIYRSMKFSIHKMAYFMLFNAFMKCLIEVYLTN